jgi:hypothetical protein
MSYNQRDNCNGGQAERHRDAQGRRRTTSGAACASHELPTRATRQGVEGEQVCRTMEE